MTARQSALRTAPAIAALALAAAAPGAVRADDEETLRRVSFHVERTRDVANDWMEAVIGVTDEDTDPAQLADRVNQTMARALERARAAEGVKVRSGGYSTRPIDRKGEIRRWRAQQDLVLESGDTEVLTRLLGELQSRLQLRSVRFTVSPERRRRVEDELIGEALGAFQERAELVRTSLHADGWAIVRLGIQPSGGGPPPRPYARAMTMEAADVAPPALEGGESQLQVRVDATIELR